MIKFRLEIGHLVTQLVTVLLRKRSVTDTIGVNARTDTLVNMSIDAKFVRNWDMELIFATKGRVCNRVRGT